MNRQAFERLVADGYERLPEWVRAKIKNVALLIEDEPSEEVRQRERLERDETLLGYYRGIPLSARGSEYGVGVTMPDTITIYRLPTLDMHEETGQPIPDIVADTVWHEFAHHFGMDEHEVRTREDERDAGRSFP
jgi:predicted Zn-dependent protease with MMP-like domain